MHLKQEELRLLVHLFKTSGLDIFSFKYYKHWAMNYNSTLSPTQIQHDTTYNTCQQPLLPLSSLCFYNNLEFLHLLVSEWKSWHIPGSINIPWTEFVNEDKLTLKSREALLALFKSHNIDIMTDPIKSTCRRGIYACAMALAAFAAGREDIPVYDGSWEEFSSRARKEEYMTDK